MPTSVGSDNGTVVISSNDPNEAEYPLALVAEVIPAPVFVLSEESITVDMVSYAQDTTELIISNLGDGTLEYSFEIGGDEEFDIKKLKLVVNQIETTDSLFEIIQEMWYGGLQLVGDGFSDTSGKAFDVEIDECDE